MCVECECGNAASLFSFFLARTRCQKKRKRKQARCAMCHRPTLFVLNVCRSLRMYVDISLSLSRSLSLSLVLSRSLSLSFVLSSNTHTHVLCTHTHVVCTHTTLLHTSGGSSSGKTGTAKGRARSSSAKGGSGGSSLRPRTLVA